MNAISLILMSLGDLACLYIACWLTKRYYKPLPEALIPIFAVVLSFILSLVKIPFGTVTPTAYYIFEIGIVHGFAAVGINQTYKQLKRFVIYLRDRKKLMDGKKIN